MSVAACLLLYSFVVAVLVPRPLGRLTRTGVSPQLGLAAWLAAIGSVLASWAVAAAFLADDVVRHWNQPERIAVRALRRCARSSQGRPDSCCRPRCSR